jgi:hypothetical protein
MSERRASVIVCDDILFSITGKVFLQGVYQTDITIPGDELTIGQFIFYFTVETPKENPFKKITLSVLLPGGTPNQFEVPLASIAPTLNPNRPKMVLRSPFLIQQPILRPGKIETKVITESGEIDAGGAWMVSVPQQAVVN